MAGAPYPHPRPKQVANFTLPHEWEEQRIQAQLVFAKVSLIFVAVAVLISVSTLDPVPFAISLGLPAFFCIRYFWLKRRLAKFMKGAGF